MDTRTETITPAKAEAWLNTNTSNRKLRSGVVEQYASDMKAGRWTRCLMPIAFYADGELADGQHRLWAIVESSTSQEFLIARGLSRKDGLNIDTGLNRSVVDNSRISGVGGNMSNELVSVARATHFGLPSMGRASNAQKIELVELHRDACTWAIANGPKGKGIRNAITLAAVARAWYANPDLARLRRFGDVMSDGFSQGDEESAAVAIRNYLQTKGAVLASSALWADTFLKVQNAIVYFLAGRKLTVIKGVKEEAYPLPRRLSQKVKVSR